MNGGSLPEQIYAQLQVIHDPERYERLLTEYLEHGFCQHQNDYDFLQPFFVRKEGFPLPERWITQIWDEVQQRSTMSSICSVRLEDDLPTTSSYPCLSMIYPVAMLIDDLELFLRSASGTISETIDHAVLHGTGEFMPQGLVNIPDIRRVFLGNSQLDSEVNLKIIKSETSRKAMPVRHPVWLMNATTAALFSVDKLGKTTWHVNNHMSGPAGIKNVCMIFGDFRALTIKLLRRIMIYPAVSSDERMVKLRVRCDVQVVDRSAFRLFSVT